VFGTGLDTSLLNVHQQTHIIWNQRNWNMFISVIICAYQALVIWIHFCLVFIEIFKTLQKRNLLWNWKQTWRLNEKNKNEFSNWNATKLNFWLQVKSVEWIDNGISKFKSVLIGIECQVEEHCFCDCTLIPISTTWRNHNLWCTWKGWRADKNNNTTIFK
jgi:hypothetical protein